MNALKYLILIKNILGVYLRAQLYIHKSDNYDNWNV